MAKLHFRYSAMNSGKSIALLATAHNYESRDREVLIAKPGVDTKGDNRIVSRLGIDRPADYLIEPQASVIELMGPAIVRQNIACVLVDEAQFLQPNQVDELYWGVSQDLNTPVIAYGLRADFLAKPFPASERLMTLADELAEMHTLCCKCNDKRARFNTRMVDGSYVFEGDQIAIDGDGVTYESLCKTCYRLEYLAATGVANAVQISTEILDQEGSVT